MPTITGIIEASAGSDVTFLPKAELEEACRLEGILNPFDPTKSCDNCSNSLGLSSFIVWYTNSQHNVSRSNWNLAFLCPKCVSKLEKLAQRGTLRATGIVLEDSFDVLGVESTILVRNISDRFKRVFPELSPDLSILDNTP